MLIAGYGPINKTDTLAYPKMPKEQTKEALQDSNMTAFYQKISYLKMQNIYKNISDKKLIENTTFPGQSHAIVCEIAEILTYVKNPLTGQFLLDPQIFAKLSTEEKKKLSNKILLALKDFQSIYMGLVAPDGSLGTFECRRILTIHAGIMLTQLTNPHTGKPYLDPKKLPRRMQVNMSEGSHNSMAEALKEFLQVVLPSEGDYSIISNYHILRDFWEKSKLGHSQK